MAEQEQDRSEAATPHKLHEARKRGAVAKSTDLTATAILAGTVAFLYALGWSTTRRELGISQAIFGYAGHLDWSVNGVMNWIGLLLQATLQALLPFLLLVAVIAILVNLVQAGMVFSAEPLKPDFDRLNPVNGFKRMFSLRVLYEAAKGLLKLAVIGGVLYATLRRLVPSLLTWPGMDPHGYPRLILDQLASLLFKLALVMLVFALVDVIYTRREFAKRMRMSKREVRDEHKQREGDPRIRARLRELRVEFLKRSRALRALPSADVVLTNPTHYAVAVSYKHGDMPAPKVVAKGAGELAGKIREAARRHRIPVVQNPPLARALYQQVQDDAYVPEQLYPQLARILLWVYSMRQAHTARRGAH